MKRTLHIPLPLINQKRIPPTLPRLLPLLILLPNQPHPLKRPVNIEFPEEFLLGQVERETTDEEGLVGVAADFGVVFWFDCA